jgi:hypothetical protein
MNLGREVRESLTQPGVQNAHTGLVRSSGRLRRVIDEVVCEQRVEECEIAPALHLLCVGTNDCFGGVIGGRCVAHTHETP